MISRGKYIFLGLILFTLAFAGVIAFGPVRAQGVAYDLAGWVWTETYGWISLSSKNCATLPATACQRNGIEYGVSIASDGDVQGYGWSEHVGWACFGSVCGGQPQPGVDPIARLDRVTGQLIGWAKFDGVPTGEALRDDGWVHLGNGRRAPTPARGESCYDCTPVCEVPIIDEQTGRVVGCNRYSTTQFETCKVCLATACFGNAVGSGDDTSNCAPGNQQPPGVNGDDPVSGGGGQMCSGFADCALETAGIASRIVCTNSTNAQCLHYGARSVTMDGALVGWSWNGNGASNPSGAGWLKWHGFGAGIVYPWLETSYGAIYAGPTRSVRQLTASSRSNATYCIFADTIVNVSSAQCTAQVSDIDLRFPTGGAQSLVYRNALGKIDVIGLSVAVNGTKNKYGHDVRQASTLTASNTWTLDNAVYTSSGDLRISQATVIRQATGAGRGNGTIIVNGNLFIDQPVTYDANTATDSDIRRLGSVAWIVKGDIIVKPGVKDIAGAFVALGNGMTCASSGGEYPRYTQNGCGAFYSVDPQGTDTARQPLTVLGLVIARAFDFRRAYADAAQGSERILYDGRLVANPPPGFQGFNDGLPVIRDFNLR